MEYFEQTVLEGTITKLTSKQHHMFQLSLTSSELYNTGML